MAQLSYQQNIPVGTVGQIADISFVKDVLSKGNPDAVVYFGRLVTKGVGDDDVAPPGAATDITDLKLVQGIVLASHSAVALPDGITEPHYQTASAVPVMRKGRVWVAVETAIVLGTSTVNARYAGTGTPGSFRGAAVTNETAVVPNAIWKSSTAAAGVAVLQIDL